MPNCSCRTSKNSVANCNPWTRPATGRGAGDSDPGDGTLLSALPLLVQAMWLKEQTGSGLVKWRFHTQFEVERFVPTRIDVTPNGGGEHDERAVLERTLEADRLYVMDRGYAKFSLFNRIVERENSYVCRLRDNRPPRSWRNGR